MARHRPPISALQQQQASKARLLARMHISQAARQAAKRGAQPLDASQRQELSLCHHVNLDAICSGQAEPTMLWDYIGGVLCWWKVAQLLQAGVAEMDAQLEVAARLCERWSRTGRVLFDGPDMQLARDGVVYMDQLAELVDTATACQAADWSQREVERLEAAALQMRTQAEQTKEGQEA